MSGRDAVMLVIGAAAGQLLFYGIVMLAERIGDRKDRRRNRWRM